MTQNMTDMMKMMNMMNMMNGNNQQHINPVYNPLKESEKDKAYLAGQTMSQVVAGTYKLFHKFAHAPFGFQKNYEPPEPSGICEVEVVSDHILDVVEKYSEKGPNYKATPNNGMNPITVNVVGREFVGSNLEINEEIRDELMNIRTNFSGTLNDSRAFPLKNDECTYLKFVTIIRQSYPSPQRFLPHPLTFRTALITISPTQTDPSNYVEGCNYLDGKMNANDFVDTLTTIECIFQLAFLKRHPVLILPPFGHNEKDNNPVNDIVKIYNYCIFKYGHLFKKIIIGIPKYYPKEILKTYQAGIINPMDLVKHIDKKYDKEAFSKQIIATQSHKKQDKQKKETKFTPEQMEMMKTLMSSMIQTN
jgi:hypothetical protein